MLHERQHGEHLADKMGNTEETTEFHMSNGLKVNKYNMNHVIIVNEFKVSSNKSNG